MNASGDGVDALLRSASKRRFVSLRVVLLSALLTVIVATIALMSLSVLRIMRQTSERQQRGTAELLARSAVLDLEHGEKIAEKWLDSQLIVGYALVESDGRVVGSDDLDALKVVLHGSLDPVVARAVAGAIVDESEAVSRLQSADGRRVVVAAASGRGEDAGRRFVVALSTGSVDGAIAAAQGLALLYMLLVGIVALALGALLVTRGVVRPMRSLLRATERVAAGDLDTRIAVGGVGELAELSRRFNTMVEHVHAARVEEAQSLSALEAANHALNATNSALQRARDDLVRADRLASVGRLAAGVAHEIGNPLASILAYLEILEEDDAEPDDVREIISSARGATHRIHKIIRELLDYSRADAPSLQWMSPAPAIEQALRLLAPQPRLRGVNVVYDAQADTPEVLLDEAKLVQVLINLILNGADAVEGDGTVRVSIEHDAERVALIVSDDGPGIPEELRSRIFDPFFTSKEPGKGTGLGLAICERLVEQMRGRMTVESSPQGCHFRVAFSRASRSDDHPSGSSQVAHGGEE